MTLRTVKIAAGLAVVGAVVVVSLTFQSTDEFSAMDYIHVGWAVANGPEPLDYPAVQYMGVPARLRDRDDIVEWLMLEAERRDPTIAADYNLGLYFLTRDCPRARYHLDTHASSGNADEFSTELARVASQEGWEAAEALVVEQGH